MTATEQIPGPIGNIASRRAHSFQAEELFTLNTFLRPHATASKAPPEQSEDSSVLTPLIGAGLPAPVYAALEELVTLIDPRLDPHKPTPELAALEGGICECARRARLLPVKGLR